MKILYIITKSNWVGRKLDTRFWTLDPRKKQMKILYLITKSNWGGAQRYVYDLAAYFDAQDEYEVAVALGGDGELKKKLEAKNIRVLRLATLERNIKISGDIRAFFEILKLLREEQPDIVHLNSSKIGFLGTIASLFYKLSNVNCQMSIVFTAHGFAFNEPRPAHQKIIIAFLQWLTVLLCDRTIVVAEHLKKQTRFWPFVSGKISIIHNGISELSFLPREESCGKLFAQGSAFSHRASRGSSRPNLVQSFPQETRIVTIAELHRNKGLDVAINALALLKNTDFTYTIIGEGEERAALEALIKKHGLGNRVFLAGHIPNAYKYLRAFDIFLLPSRTEALSYVLLEAAQAGLPIIATSVGGIPEVVEHKKNGLLVPPNDPRALANAIRYAVEHPVACALAGREFENAMRRHFAIAEMFARTREVYTTHTHAFFRESS